MSGIQDFYRGDTQRYKLTLKDVSTGTPIDLTGATIWFTMKSAITDDDTNAVIQKQVTNHIDAINGVTEIVISSAETQDLKLGSYYYDFQYVASNGDVKTILTGKVKVLGDVTRTI
jgi:hypothetical protein